MRGLIIKFNIIAYLLNNYLDGWYNVRPPERAVSSRQQATLKLDLTLINHGKKRDFNLIN